MPIFLPEFQIAGRRADRLVRFVHIQLGVLRAIVHDQIDHYSASTAGTVAGAINRKALDRTPLPAWPPILPEFVKRILRVILRMLLPPRIGVVDAISSFEVLLLQGRKELIGDTFFRPEAVPPGTESQKQNKNDCRNDPGSSLSFFFRMVLFRVQ